MRPEFPHPCPDRLIADHDTAFGQQILDITQAKREAIIRPDRVGNDGARKAVAFQARCGNLTDHRTELHNCPAEGNNLTIPSAGLVSSAGLRTATVDGVTTGVGQHSAWSKA